VYKNNRIDPHKFAVVVKEVSDYFNGAFVLAENNGKEGGRLVEALWYQQECEKLVSIEKNELGIPSTVRSKYEANILTKRCIEDSRLKIVDKQTQLELSRYEEVKPDIYRAASAGDNDDHVTALIWAVYFQELLNFINIYFDPVTKKPISEEKLNKKMEFADALPIILDGDEELQGQTMGEIIDPGWTWPQ
jgi:hypothetical protein